MEEKRGSTARSRELGAELRKRREAAQLQGVDLARKLNWSQPKISRMETGDRTASEIDVALYLAVCGVYGDDLSALLRQARDAGDEGSQRAAEGLSLTYHQTTASAIQSYEPLLIPGLLQTEDYARALFNWAGFVSEAEVERRVRVRMERKSILDQWNPPQVIFYVHEHALRPPVDEPRIMHEQLLNLLFTTSRPRVELRIVPASAGLHGCLGGPFTLMQYTQHRPVAYCESIATSTFLERKQDIDLFKAVLVRLAQVALDGGQSRELIAQLANEYEQQEAGPG